MKEKGLAFKFPYSVDNVLYKSLVDSNADIWFQLLLE